MVCGRVLGSFLSGPGFFWKLRATPSAPGEYFVVELVWLPPGPFLYSPCPLSLQSVGGPWIFPRVWFC